MDKFVKFTPFVCNRNKIVKFLKILNLSAHFFLNRTTLSLAETTLLLGKALKLRIYN